MPQFSSEAELCETLSHYLISDEWDVYQEVVMPHGGRADFVAIKGPVRWIIEAKMSASLGVVAQARKHLAYAHMVSIATPSVRRRNIDGVFRDCLASYNPRIGWLEANERWDTAVNKVHAYQQYRSGSDATMDKWLCPVRVRVHPGWRSNPSLTWTVCKEQKDFAPAGTSGTYWTPFKQTCHNLIEFLDSAEAPVLLRDVIKQIDHHYASEASARGTLSRLIQANVVSGVTAFKSGRSLYVCRD